MTEQNNILFRCHACARKIEVGKSHMGHVIKCPKCERPNVVPDPASPTEFARQKEHAELKKIYAIRDQGKISDTEFETVTRKVYELAWGAPPEAVKKKELKPATPQFGGAAADAQKSEAEDADFHAWLQHATAMVEDDPQTPAGSGSPRSNTMSGIAFDCENCGAKLNAPLNLIGQEFICQECHHTMIVPLPEGVAAAKSKETGIDSESVLELADDEPEIPAIKEENIVDTSTPATVAPVSGNKKYKVITQDDDLLGGRFDPVSLEKALNAYFTAGWRMVSSTNATFVGESKAKVMIVLEKIDE